MTVPTMTYGPKFCSDLTNLTEVWEGTSGTWTETLNNMLVGHAVESILYGDILQIAATFDGGAGVDEYCYYSYPSEAAGDLDFASNDYPLFLIHYKTSGSATSPGAQAKAELVFDDASTQEVLPACYSTTWAVAATEITSGKTIDHVRLYADDVGTDGTFYVWYDFALMCLGQFDLPFVDRILRVPMRKKMAVIEIPGRDGDIEQDLGMNSPRIRLEGTMDANTTTWGSPYGSILYTNLRGSYGGYHDPWQWFTSDIINCKVKIAPEGFVIAQDKTVKAQRTWSLDLILHSLSSLDEAAWDSLQWAGQ